MSKRKYSASDFTYDGLPHTRKEQYFDLLKTRFSLIWQLGGVLLLFSLPFLLAYAFNNIGLIPYAEGNYSGEQLKAFLATNEFIFSLVYSACFVIIAIGLSGIANIIKKYAWGQGIYFWHDFRKGVKQNGFYFGLTSFLFSTLFVAATLLGGLFSNAILGQIPDAVLLLFVPLFLIVLVGSSIYKGSYFSMWKNSFALFSRLPAQFILSILFPFAMLFIEVIPYPVISLGIYVVLFAILIPLYAFAFYFICLSGFDKFTNVSLFPEYYHLGLYDQFDELIKKSSMKEDLSSRNQD